MDHSEKSLRIYLRLMQIVRYRFDAINKIMEAKVYKVPYKPNQVEFCVLQIRKILEIIAMGSLVVNRDLYRQHYDEIETMWHGKKILQSMRK